VILFEATEVKVVENTAVLVSPLPDSVPVPNVVEPFLNVTVPVGPAPEAPIAVAVSTVVDPTATGLTAALTAVVVVTVAAAIALLSIQQFTNKHPNNNQSASAKPSLRVLQ
jgi:uncharacterized membrane protein